ncbi:hypothetical protein PV328_006216 [Microctonus aethiopoides]|uniref:Craniofacial development protein 1 n=1 Tax=Microctonus aethiopoides TaxID=144406 RepID=A0AA39FNN1_9HYME|nr:hypothetical protein PV328_006216 [Microctonus aethiopoides]
MSKEHELPSDSDEDDEDYVPDGGEILSEVESEGEAESGPEEENNENIQVSKIKSGKRGKSGNKSKAKKKKVEAEDKVDDNNDDDDDEKEKKKVLTEEEEKKKADSLWADFMSDTGTIFKPKPQKIPSKSQENLPVRPKVMEKVKITKVFEFAGEEVKVEKEVDKNSAEGRLTLSTDSEKSSNDTINTAQKRAPRGRVGGLGGISSVLSQIGKKTKISTLEKSKLDWDSFKKQENLDEEINTHNKGKDGYLERQDFLQRADLRQFEIEKELRTTVRRSNR